MQSEFNQHTISAAPATLALALARRDHLAPMAWLGSAWLGLAWLGARLAGAVRVEARGVEACAHTARGRVEFWPRQVQQRADGRRDARLMWWRALRLSPVLWQLLLRRWRLLVLLLRRRRRRLLLRLLRLLLWWPAPRHQWPRLEASRHKVSMLPIA